MELSLDRRGAAVEIAIFGALAIILRLALDPVAWRFAGPVSLILTLAGLMAYLNWRGEGWSSVGLIPLRGLRSKLMIAPQGLLTFALFGVAVAVTVFGGQAIGLELMKETPSGVNDRWGDVAGHLPKYLMWMGITWTAVAFGEEMFFRGFLITRVEALFQGAPLAKVFAVVLPALLFGAGHFYYQGARGLITAGGIGIAFGTSFLLFKRNLWPIVFVHGIVDSINFSALYFGWDNDF